MKAKIIRIVLGSLVVALAVAGVLLVGAYYVRDFVVVDGVEVETTKSIVERLTLTFYISIFASLLVLIISEVESFKQLELKHYIYFGLYVLQGIVIAFFTHWVILLAGLLIMVLLEYIVFRHK
ncbi:MAG TPA: hypothetical protein GX003_01390 [Acholeplasmataceae bacterium]|jgi:hypothetical protein|nr:hypothetical protein [Acholeplasmataceae bacterium]